MINQVRYDGIVPQQFTPQQGHIWEAEIFKEMAIVRVTDLYRIDGDNNGRLEHISEIEEYTVIPDTDKVLFLSGNIRNMSCRGLGLFLSARFITNNIEQLGMIESVSPIKDIEKNIESYLIR